MADVVSSHIQITLSCPKCGHEWDVDDNDSESTVAAEMAAQEEECPNCGRATY